MTKNFDKLELGGFYRSIRGNICGPMVKNKDGGNRAYCFRCDVSTAEFTEKGFYYDSEDESDHNLVERVQVISYPEQKKESNKVERKFKVGDRVKFIHSDSPLLDGVFFIKSNEHGNLCSLFSDNSLNGGFAHENQLELVKPKLELFVGAIVKLKNGDTTTVIYHDISDNTYRCSNCWYVENGKAMHGDYIGAFDILEILNPKSS